VKLAARAVPGSRTLQLQGLPLCRAGESLAIGPERPNGAEVVQVAAVRGRTVQLRVPLREDHPAGEPTTTEFVRYRWYPDAQVGTTYFHDHVDAISSWRHGLFGALVVEPPDATWSDPSTGAPLSSGRLADVTTRGSVGVDAKGSFRELVALLQDDVRVNQSSHSTGGALGMTASPPLGTAGRPGTMVRAYVGDPVVVRTLVPGTNDIHTLFVEGHRFRVEPWSPTSGPVNAVHVGISERFDVVIPSAGGDGRRAGDYVFGDGRQSKLREGVWGILRVLPRVEASLRPLAGRPLPQAPAEGPVCPAGARSVHADLTAVADPDLVANGAALVAEGDAAHPSSAGPAVLHIAVGDCLELRLRNRLVDQPVQLRTALLVNTTRDPAVPPGGTGTFTFYAPPALGEATSDLRDVARPVDGPERGLYGAIVVAAKGSSFRSPSGGKLPQGAPGAQVVVRPPDGSPYRDFTVFPHDTDAELGTHQMPYRHEVIGTEALSYGRGTQRLLAYPRDPIRLHVVAAVSEQVQAFSLDGHRWRREPDAAGSTIVATQAIGAREVVTAVPLGGAGGEEHLPGDYVYGDSRGPYREAGVWGVLRVLPHHERGLAPLRGTSRFTVLSAGVAVGAAVAFLLLVVLSARRRSRWAARRTMA
jgi:hypothetical protein